MEIGGVTYWPSDLVSVNKEAEFDLISWIKISQLRPALMAQCHPVQPYPVLTPPISYFLFLTININKQLILSKRYKK